MLNLNFNVEPHKYLEVIKGADTVIVLFSDDGSTIKKEVHTFSTVAAGDAVGFLEPGMIIENITNFTASGDWEDRYELEYTDDAEEADGEGGGMDEEQPEDTQTLPGDEDQPK